MTDACYCDFDGYWDVYRSTEHVARKPHKCYECGRKIMPGERYEMAFAIGDGDKWVMPTCPHCLDIRKWVVAHVPCSCWSHGNMLEDVRDDVEAFSEEAEGSGFVFGYLRRVALMQRARGWIRKDGRYVKLSGLFGGVR